MFSLYKLQAKGYFANIFSKADFITTIMFLVVLGSITSFSMANNSMIDLETQQGINQLSYANIGIISSITILMVMNSALYSFGFSFFEMKQSVLLKRIGATKISKIEAVSAFIMWGFTTMIFMVSWIAIWVGFFQIPAIAEWTNGLLYVAPELWKDVNWLGVVTAIIVTSISFYAISFLFVSISKNSEMYNILTTFYFFFVAFLGGSFTPNSGRDWMMYVGYLSPLGWASEMMSHSMLGGEVFHFGGYEMSNGQEVDALHSIGHILFPIVYGGLAGTASIKLFKWDS